ncbi:WD40-repeat-containing domain protein [Xylogone sp. PMI_703]|nr:WD40-repeat-containing domain protein [Xylogone sp. PMI_703]
MSRSTDPGHFFQTDAAETTRARRAAKSGNKFGDPIILQSKILNAIADPFSSTCIYVAESAGCVRKVNVETNDTKTVYKGPAAPVTSVAVGGTGGATIFAGCWDKSIWSWDRESRAPSTRYNGHSDFVKCVISAKIGEKDCVISGGADAKIIVWDTKTGEKLHTLRDKTETMMAVQDLVLDPDDSTDGSVVLVSSSSDPHIRRWRISVDAASQIVDIPSNSSGPNNQSRDTIREHETSVYRVLFSGDEESDLWTASADGSAKCLSRARHWDAEESYEHGDYVRAIAITSDWIITAGRDEDIKVWDRTSGKLWHIYEGHYEEVTALVVMQGERKLVSVSIDGTVRSWGLGRGEIETAKKEQEERRKGVAKEEDTTPKSLLTAEEEAELAELMDED